MTSQISETREINQIDLRNAFGQFATGVNVVTSTDTDGALIGMTANSFSSVSMDPPLLLWCPGNSLPSLPAFERAGHFTINVLDASQHDIAKQFARPAEDKFAGVSYRKGIFGAPVLDGALATFECRVHAMHLAGDHHIMIGEVFAFTTAETAQPLIFYGGQFSSLAS